MISVPGKPVPSVEDTCKWLRADNETPHWESHLLVHSAAERFENGPEVLRCENGPEVPRCENGLGSAWLSVGQ